MLLLLLMGVVLGEASGSDFGEFLKLLLSIVKAPKMVGILRYKVWFDWVAFTDEVEAADLLFKAS